VDAVRLFARLRGFLHADPAAPRPPRLNGRWNPRGEFAFTSGLYWRGAQSMLSTILIIILILILIGALPRWGYSTGWGYGPGGIVGVILIIVVILALMGRI
jgi:hypothetical protein